MSWKFWKRNSKDPLARVFLDKYYLHLLALPRKDVSIGDLYPYDGTNILGSGNISNFLIPSLKVSPTKIGESAADISGTISDSISVDTGLDILEVFLAALGAPNIGIKVRTNYQIKKTRSMRFHFTDVKRDYVDMFLLGNVLEKSTINKHSAIYSESYKYYLVTGVVRTESISIIGQDEKGHVVDIDTGSIINDNTLADVSIQKSQSVEGEIQYKGKQKLAFGVELHELGHDSNDKIKIMRVKETVRARGQMVTREALKPSFIGGDSLHGNMFLAEK